MRRCREVFVGIDPAKAKMLICGAPSTAWNGKPGIASVVDPHAIWQEIGRVEPKLEQDLIRLMGLGNQYAVFVTAAIDSFGNIAIACDHG